MKLTNRFLGAQLLRFGVVATLATGVLATAAGRGTLAYFTTQNTSTANLFTAGTLRLVISDVNEGPSTSTVASSITFANMKPGDVRYAPIEIANTGTLNAVYGISYVTSTSGSQDLAPGLALAIKGTVVGAGTGTKATVAADAAHACSSTNFATALIWSDDVRAAAAMVAGAGQTIQAVSSATNAPAAAVGRALVADTGVDVLCLQVTFTDPGASNVYNNAVDGATNTTVVFTFDGLVAAAAVTTNP